MVYPSLLTGLYFVWLAGDSASKQQAVYLAGKALQFALPAIWVGIVCRERLGWPRPTGRGVAIGVAFALAASAGMLVVYYAWLRPLGIFQAAAAQMRDREASIGISGPPAYAMMAVFYSLAHSLLEEYYWRWFVFGRIRRLAPAGWAILVSALAFAAHHVIVLSQFFGLASGWTWLFSAATAIGGAFWAWLYHRSQSIYGPWISHMLIDAGIFAIGYDLVARA